MQWFKHDVDANQDAKLQNVLLDYGLEGYGLYWYCIELIAGKVGPENISFCLEHDARIIARNTGSTVQKVEEMMRYFVKEGLFESSEGVITCLKLAKRLNKSMTSNPQMRDLIGVLRGHDGIMTESPKVMQDKIRLDKNKDLDQSKIDRANFINEAFEFWWSKWPKKVGKKATFKIWQKITKPKTDEEVRALTNHIADDVALRMADIDAGGRKYIGFDMLHPSTYLNQERYNDDI